MKKSIMLGLVGALVSLTNSSFQDKAEAREVPKDDTNRKKNFEPKKQGQKQFTFPDGFTCQALNQKSADKKHSKAMQVDLFEFPHLLPTEIQDDIIQMNDLQVSGELTPEILNNFQNRFKEFGYTFYWSLDMQPAFLKKI